MIQNSCSLSNLIYNNLLHMKCVFRIFTSLRYALFLHLLTMLILNVTSQQDIVFQNRQISISLPQNYIQTPDSTPLHPIKIVPQFVLETIHLYEYSQNIRKAFHIAAYYFSQILKVDTINPRSQTILPTDTQCFGFNIPTKYFTQGFDPNQIDMVIFIETSTYQWPYAENPKNTAGVCLLERRPLYGYIYYLYYHASFRTMGQYSFHRNIQIMVHLMIHILAFNPIYFLQTTDTAVLSIILNEDHQTLYFQNAYSAKKLLQKQVIKKHSQNMFIFKTPQIRKFFHQFFGCEGKSDIQNVGLLLKTYYWENDQYYIQFHFDAAQGISIDLLHEDVDLQQNGPYYKHTQHKMITIIELLLLKDTGFYEQVILDKKFYNQLVRSSLKTQKFQYQVYDACTLQQLNINHQCLKDQQGNYKMQSSCDVYGYTLSQTVQNSNFLFILDGQCQGSFFYNCQVVSLPDRRCILRKEHENENKDYGRFNHCNTAKCVQIQGKKYLYLNAGSKQLLGCANGQKYIQIEGTQMSFECPQNMEAFCGAKTCSNFCSHEGLCIRGKCLIPQTPRKLDDGSLLVYDQYYFGYCRDNITNETYMCPIGCLSCICSNLRFLCLKALSGFGFGYSNLMVNNIYQYQRTEDCQKKVFECRYYGNGYNYWYSIRCFDKYYFSAYRSNWDGICYKCVSATCSSCSDIYLQSRCTNCVQNHFINEYYICEKCQGLQNCKLCFRKSNQDLICQECIKGYHLFNNTCYECLPSCGKCSNQDFTICEGCFAGSFLTYNSGINGKLHCQPCSQGCKICFNFTFCQLCSETHFPTSIDFQSNQTSYQKVQFCAPVCQSICVRCKLGRPEICQQCPVGYTLNQSSKKCDINGSYFQDEYKGFCPFSYFYSQTSFKCISCNVQNCLFCYQGALGTHYCSYCYKGFFRNQQDINCNVCPQQCQTCVSYDSCLTCKEGFVHPKNIDGSVFNTQCVKCTHNCKTCIQNTHHCLTCNQGFKKIGLRCLLDRKQLFYNLTFQENYESFLSSYEYSLFIPALLKSLQFEKYSQATLLDMEKGSIKMWIRMNYDQSSLNSKLKQKLFQDNPNPQTSQNCFVFIQISQKLKDGLLIEGLNKSYFLTQFTYKIDQGCEEQVLSYQRYSEEVSQYGVSPTVVAIIVASNIVISIFFIILAIIIVIAVTLNSRRKIQKITLKYEQLKSKQQYMSSSLDSIKKQAF